MKLQLTHITTYQYEEAVELNTHALFLKPLHRPYYRVENYRLQVMPEPEGMVERLSLEANPFFQLWFTGLTERLELRTSFEAYLQPFNPFSFILELDFVSRINPGAERVFHYDPREETILYPSLQTSPFPEGMDFAGEELRKMPDNPISYLMGLTAAVHKGWRHLIREEEDLWSPEKTFFRREGSCRDLSWMLIHLLRMQGMAARFVSGYAYNPALEEGHELHAWVEAYLPGAGWLGMDPSLGLFTDERYIPLACSSEADFTLPVHGNYGGSARASLHTHVEISQH